MAAPSDELLPGGFHPFKPVLEKDSGLTTNLARPATDATITVRVIKNFEYRTMKNLVLRDVDLVRTTAGALIALCRDQVRSVPGFKPFRPAADSLGMSLLRRPATASAHTHAIVRPRHSEAVQQGSWRQDHESDHQPGPPGIHHGGPGQVARRLRTWYVSQRQPLEPD